ncbi:hypothetical protein H072_10468 [Dactylellina haptotyla CBS 200.50]|uniref:Uncharacterized protein n=1 Tax=Dactylellina haptotyla (strain CBS 200.50) TaxID=1284197 RepID=S8BAB0_DACHA|nr:hypothetical protein H072_10468 [Dactylellina haptotyla CBS 200.50]
MLSGFIYTLIAANALSVAAAPLGTSDITGAVKGLPIVGDVVGDVVTTATGVVPATLKALIPADVDISVLSVVTKEVGSGVATVKGVAGKVFDLSVFSAICCTNPTEVLSGGECAPAKCVMGIVSSASKKVTTVLAESDPTTGIFDLKSIRVPVSTDAVTGTVTTLFTGLKVDQVVIGLKDTVKKTTDGVPTGTLIAFVKAAPNTLLTVGLVQTAVSEIEGLAATVVGLVPH